MADDNLSDPMQESEGSKKKEKKEKKKEKEKEKKSKSEKETKYAHLAEGSSGEEEYGKSPSKTAKKAKGFKFVSSKREKDDSKRGQSKPISSHNASNDAADGNKVAKKRAKIFKSHHSKHHTSALHHDDSSHGRVQLSLFGVPLAVAVARDRSHDGLAIPVVFRVCIDHLEKHGLDQEGIYRASGLKSKVKKLRDDLNTRCNVDLNEFEPSVVASVLKQFLRELPEPILTKELQSKFEAVADLRDEQQLLQLKKLHDQLPECNKLLFDYLLLHMLHVVRNEKVNKMSLQNVCIVLSPTLQISHPLLACLFRHANQLLEGVVIQRYIPPLTGPDLVRRLPTSIDAIEAEMVRQESLLAELHSQISSGASSKRSEEQIWEHQRAVTELRRRLRVAKRDGSSVEPNKSYEPIDYEEEIDFELQTPRSVRTVQKKKDKDKPEERDESDETENEAGEITSGQLEKEEVVEEPGKTKTVEEEKDEMDACTEGASEEKKTVEKDIKETEATSSNASKPQVDHVSTVEVVCDREKSATTVEVVGAKEKSATIPEEGTEVAKQSSKVGPHVTIINLEQPTEPAPIVSDKSSTPKASNLSKMTDEAVQTEIVSNPPSTESSSKRIHFSQDSKSSFPILLPKPPAPNKTRATPKHVNKVNTSVVPLSSNNENQGRQKSKSLPRGVLPSDLSRFSDNKDYSKAEESNEQDAKAKEDEAILMETLRLQFEHEELLALKQELERRKAREMEEVEELREELASMQTLYQYRACSVDSSESSSEETSSTLSGSKSSQADSMTQTLANLVRENKELESTRLSLSAKIEEERKACLDLRVQIRLEQERIRMRKEGAAINSLI